LRFSAIFLIKNIRFSTVLSDQEYLIFNGFIWSRISNSQRFYQIKNVWLSTVLSDQEFLILNGFVWSIMIKQNWDQKIRLHHFSFWIYKKNGASRYLNTEQNGETSENLLFKTRKTKMSSTVRMILRFKGCSCESGI
jgi:hypothetical protein